MSLLDYLEAALNKNDFVESKKTLGLLRNSMVILYNSFGLVFDKLPSFPPGTSFDALSSDSKRPEIPCSATSKAGGFASGFLALKEQTYMAQSMFNWMSFYNSNQACVSSGSNEVLMIVLSKAADAQDEKLAVEFVKSAVPIVCVAGKTHGLVVSVDAKFKDVFLRLRENTPLINSDSSEIKDWNCFSRERAVCEPDRQAIVLRVYMKISAVDRVLYYLNALSNYPQVQFLDPITTDDIESQYANAECANPREGSDKCEIGTYTEEKAVYYNVAAAQAKSNKNASSNSYCACWARKYTKQTAVSQVAQNKTDSYALCNVPYTVEICELKNRLSNAIGCDVNVNRINQRVICNVDSQFNDELVSVLNRLKINGTLIIYQKY